MDASKAIVTAELDMAYEADIGFVATCQELSRRYDMVVVLIKANGPGGGWPVVKLVGERGLVRQALSAEWGFDPDEIEPLLVQPEAVTGYTV